MIMYLDTRAEATKIVNEEHANTKVWQNLIFLTV